MQHYNLSKRNKTIEFESSGRKYVKSLKNYYFIDSSNFEVDEMLFRDILFTFKSIATSYVEVNQSGNKGQSMKVSSNKTI